ncbi:MAG: DNA polymerase III subunit gamma/tau [Chitinophagaceae bacterium]|nr:DNA polymerase III subunit gamma/tau [Chitinophagaceae bacterium]
MNRFIVSARKYRPQTFDTVIGQEHITTTLKNAIKNEQLAHAFLFCGPRGVGKTTCARILAKTINCENRSPDGEACNVCNSCISFNEGTSLNIYELDAASNNSVDDIRSLVEQVRFAPQAGRYKVYIIDEVHMLSSSAFNAFLKTLEEPPSYAIFILATTEKHKILPTILSRCQIFDFKRITIEDTVQHLATITKREHIHADEPALQTIAQKSEGCLRDALSILDKIVSFTNGNVTYANTLEHLNILDADYYFRLFEFMLAQDLAGAMLLYDDIDKKGFEGDIVLNGFAEFLRNLLICKDERVSSLLDVVESFKQRYAETAKKADAAYLISALNILNEAEINYKMAKNKRLHIELALIKLCYLRQALQLTEGASIEKNNMATAKPIAFRNITPIIYKQPNSTTDQAKLIIEVPAEKPVITVSEQQEPYETVKQNENNVTRTTKKISKLEAIRQQVQQDNCTDKSTGDKSLEIEVLKNSWNKFIEQLKQEKNPAAQSFRSAELFITDANSFEAVVTNNLDLKFLEKERNNASEFLKKDVCNKQLRFSILLKNNILPHQPTDMPLNAKEQYQKIIEQYPLVKELKDRLRLELDY